MNTSVETVRTVAAIEAEILAIRQARKDAKQKFQADLDQRFIDYRAEVKSIREKREQLFAELEALRKAEKLDKKAAKKVTEEVAIEPEAIEPEVKVVKTKKAVKKAVKKAAKKPTKKAAKKEVEVVENPACVVVDIEA